MKKIITMGEILLRLSAPRNERLIQADEFDVNYGGGEANVAVSLSNYGYNTEFITKVPDNAIGASAVAALRKVNVGTHYIAYGGERLGLYFLEIGSSLRPSSVVYDRAHSSISTAVASDFDFDAIFAEADLFHFSGITPALSADAAELVKQACIAAKKHGVKISCDINYRSKLWSFEDCQRVMMGLMQYVDFFFGSAGDGLMVLGKEKQVAFGQSRDYQPEAFSEIYEQLIATYGFELIVSSMRVSRSASDNSLSGCIYSAAEHKIYRSREYLLTPIVDRVGGGDALTGGVLCGILDGRTPAEALEFGVAASALKHTIPGDYNLVSRAEVELLMGGDGSGRVQR